MNELSPRLGCIVSLLGQNEVVADIGCDHGLISLFLAQNNLADKVFATDISAPSLEKARQSAAKAGLHQIEFCCGDGFAPLPQKPDAAVIAGMGGDTVAKIIRHPYAQTKLVLQPMRDAGPVYRVLPALDMHAESIRIVQEGRRFYEVILALPGKKSFVWEDRVEPNSTSVAYLKRRKFFLERALKQTARASSKQKSMENLKQELDWIKGVIQKWQP